MNNIYLREEVAEYYEKYSSEADFNIIPGLTQSNIVRVLGGSRYISEPMVPEVAPVLETDAPRHWRMLVVPKGVIGLKVTEFGISEPGTDRSMVSVGHELKTNTDIRLNYDNSIEVQNLFAGIGQDVISLVAQSGDFIFSGIERRVRKSEDDQGHPLVTEWSQLVYSKELLKTTDVAREAVIYLRNKRKNVPSFIHNCALEGNRDRTARFMALSALAQTIER